MQDTHGSPHGSGAHASVAHDSTAGSAAGSMAHGLPHGLYDAFLAVARSGSFTAAARALGYTQSAVSRQVRSLEEEWGAELFERLPRGVRLTEAGRALLPHAEAVRDRLAAARAELTALRTLEGGLLRLGSFSSATAALVPRAQAAFRERHPGVVVTRVEGPSVKHLALVAAGEEDLAVVSPAVDAPPPTGVTLHHLLDEPMLVALERGHRYAGRRDVRLAELSGEEWIVGNERLEDTLLRPALAAGLRPRTGLLAHDWIAKLGAVAAGLGVTLVPALAASSVRPDVALVTIHPDDVPYRRICAASPGAPTAAATAFLERLRATAEELRAWTP
ncbi:MULTISPECIES: LysR family transcriptional regulator [Streptomyces]|uniref:LysR family transcriptional regulator n=2 Tax=Streptomyces TaxID=1883 RepID=A0ABU4KJ93_9ACTN|nr:LysR family transcriptional regulator [Streptomyces roseolus]MDX2297877.1 LysR family transcriptional regulator [Streptomyces roseolus]